MDWIINDGLDYNSNYYFLRKLNILISNALITHILINFYYLWSLKSTLRALV